MKIILTFLAPLFVVSAASADFTGKWAGKGTLEGDQQPQPCETMRLDLVQSSDQFEIVKGMIMCGFYVNRIPATQLKIERGALIDEQGKKVGMISDGQLHYEKIGKNGQAKVVHDILIKTDKSMDYEQTVFDQSGKEIAKFKGVLSL